MPAGPGWVEFDIAFGGSWFGSGAIMAEIYKSELFLRGAVQPRDRRVIDALPASALAAIWSRMRCFGHSLSASTHRPPAR
jgi:hypothetical protein